MQQYDVVVIGAGMVGAAVALGFARKEMQVALVEPHFPPAFSPEQAPDLRVSAISLASEQFLRDIGAWNAISAMRMHPYRRLMAWEQESGRTVFDAHDCQYEHMGYMIENRVIQLGLHQELRQLPNVHWFNSYEELRPETGEVLLFEGGGNEGERVQAGLVVAADGAQSRARQGAGIATGGWQYQQSVLSITIHCHYRDEQRTDADMTWQQFTPTGPKAFLPLFDDSASLIWYDQNQTVKQLSPLPHAELKQRIQQAFPERLPDFDIIDVGSFPLTRMHAKQYVKGRLVLVGDSAHTINPLAGQGVNLGFKDAVQLLNEVSSTNDALAVAKALNQYERKRKPQNLLMMSAMDAIYGVFSNDLPPLKIIRNSGLMLANRMGWAKQQVMKYAMGMV